MSAVIPMHYIEIVDKANHSTAGIIGTRFSVADIVLMHLKNHSSMEWMVENFESLDYAKIHAALAYYYDHQAEIEAEIAAMRATDEHLEATATNLETLRAKIQARQQQ